MTSFMAKLHEAQQRTEQVRKKIERAERSTEPEIVVPDNVIHRSGDDYERVATTDVLEHALGILPEHQNEVQVRRIARAMAAAGWARNPSGKVRIDGVPIRGYIRRVPVRREP